MPPDVTVLWGETWTGEPQLRGLRPGYEVLLRGEMGHGFDRKGPAAWKCKECHFVMVQPGPIYPVDIQRHYAETHGHTPAILPE